MRLQELWLTIILSLLSLCAPSKLAAQAGNASPNSDLPQTYSATAFGQAGALSGKSFGVTVYITGWTSDQEVHQFAAVLKKNGPDGLVSALNNRQRWADCLRLGLLGAAFALRGSGQHQGARARSLW